MASTTATATTSGKAGKGAKGGEDGETPKKGKRKLLLIVLALVVVVAAAAYWFLLKPSSASASEAKPAPEPGTVLTVDPISVNLADGHYLKIGIALQAAKGAADVTDGSKALDEVISLYSNQTMAALTDPASRDKVKAELVKAVAKDYDDEVYDVYFTEYVMQ